MTGGECFRSTTDIAGVWHATLLDATAVLFKLVDTFMENRPRCLFQMKFNPQLTRTPIMKNGICSFAVSVFLAWHIFAPAEVRAGEGDGKPLTSTVAQVGKPKQVNACRTRYRNCLKANQIPSFECQYIYQDCTRKIY
jgi:hypothetical protein